MPDGPPNSAAAAAEWPDQPAQLQPGAPAPPPLSSAELQRGRVETLLEGPGYEPNQDQIRGLGTGTLRALIAVYHDTTKPEGERARALQAISYIDDGRARAELRLALERPEVAPLYKRTALFGLARSGGSTSIPEVAEALDSPDVSVRSAAAEALGQIGGPQARDALAHRLESETDPKVRAALQRSLAKASP
ncbi:MAG: HEAT repeat domain-containing protein [Deltaproteobacteria bacterium]